MKLDKVFCTKCGAPNPVSSGFCNQCGAKLMLPAISEDTIEETSEKTSVHEVNSIPLTHTQAQVFPQQLPSVPVPPKWQPTGNPPIKPPETKKKNLLWLWITLGVVVLAAVALLIIKGPEWFGNPGINMPGDQIASAGSNAAATEPPAAPTEAPTLGIGSVAVASVDGMEMAYVPAGDFLMGSVTSEGSSDEHPQHSVYLDAFWIDRTEVTNAMYRKCMDAGVCSNPYNYASETRGSYFGNSDFDDYPVIDVDWNQANQYCQWAGRQLPTEAQWEKAARGTDERVYPWGNNPVDPGYANYDQSVGDTSRVGSYSAGASPYGVYDMTGNVLEWLHDWYDPGYYSISSLNPQGPDSGSYRMLRGGSWMSSSSAISVSGYSSQNTARLAYRFVADPSYYGNSVGFRCVLNAN